MLCYVIFKKNKQIFLYWNFGVSEKSFLLLFAPLVENLIYRGMRNSFKNSHSWHSPSSSDEWRCAL